MLRKLLLSVVAFLLTASTVFAQTGSLTGIVTDDNTGEALVGANVYIAELQKGSSTDGNGQYVINDIPVGTYEVRITYIGYTEQTQTVEITSGENSLDIALQSGLALDEVIVTAFGISREKRSTAYQTESVSAEDLNTVQPTSAAEGLAGKVAGLQINHQSSGVKPSNQILLRGLRSVSGNNEALIVIDGSVASSGAFRDLNPNDIQDINVLKGATSAALYGSDASNGAIIVTTRSGQGGFKAEYSHSTSWDQVAYMPDFQTKFGSGIDREYDPIENTAWGPRFDGQPRRIGPDFPAGYPVENQIVPYAPVEDNLKNFFNTQVRSQNTIALSGGGEESSFYLSVGNNSTSGLIPDDKYEKYTFTANGSKKLGDVTLSVHSSYFQDDKNVVGSEIGAQDRAFYWFVLNTPANIPLTNYSNYTDINSYGHPDNYFSGYYQNPYWAIGENRDKDKTNRLRGNISASWDIVDNINVTGRLGINSHSGIGKDYSARQDYNSATRPAMDALAANVTDSEFQRTTVNGNFLATGEFQLDEDFGLKAILGAAVASYDYRRSTMTANNLSIPGFFDISNGTGQIDPFVNEEQKRTFGFFGDVTFNYQEWAYLNLTGRQDFTSTLPEDDNSYFYPGVGLSVILNEAIPSIGEVSFISMIKLTANYSTVYKDLDPYQISENYSQSNDFPFGSINGFFLSNTAVDENIKKEKLQSTEFGLNTSFLDERITFDAAYAFTQTTNLITNVSPSIASGATGYLTNIGKLSGSSIELSLTGNIIETRDFSWELGVNYTSYEQKVDEIQPGQDEIAIESFGAGFGTFAIKGEVFPQIKTISYKRDPQGRVIIDPSSGNPIIGDLQPQGKTTPDYTLGFNTSAHYKGVSISATADYRTGYVYYAQGQDLMEFTARSLESAAANRQNFVWPNSSYPDGSGGYTANTNIPITGGGYNFWANHYNEIKENYVKDATAFKLRELAITYDVPVELLNETKVIKGLKVGLVGRNLLTILPEGQSKFSDPEFRNTRRDDEANGIGIGGYLSPPPTRSFGFNVNIEF